MSLVRVQQGEPEKYPVFALDTGIFLTFWDDLKQGYLLFWVTCVKNRLLRATPSEFWAVFLCFFAEQNVSDTLGSLGFVLLDDMCVEVLRCAGAGMAHFFIDIYIQSDKTTKINTYFFTKEVIQVAVFRIERNRDYTVMSNHHLRDTELSLKAKGLLSMMLSLPEEWNYTTRGLAAICKEGADCIGSALRELEQAGYIVRSRIRDSKGKIVDVEYIIYETPHKPRPQSAPPEPERPGTENPDMDTPCPTCTCNLR